MALSEENEIEICKILNIEPSVLDYQLSYISTDFTTARQTAVEAEIERWATKGKKFTKIEGGEFAAFIDPEREKNDIRKNIAVLLERPEWASSGGGMTSRVQRG